MTSLSAELPLRDRSQTGLATAAVAVSTMFWGTAWMPMRLLKERGLDAVSTVVLLFLIVAVALSPAAYWRRQSLRADGRALVLAGLTGGTSMTCYYLSVTMTSIAHATLLFYLTPIWAVIIECVALKQRLRLISVVEVSLGLLGLCVILGPGLVSERTINLGDVLAFAAGISFAVSSFFMYSAPGPGASGYTWAWALGSVASAGLAAILVDAGGIARAIAVPGSGLAIFVPLLAFALCMFMPMNMLTLWGARLLSPARVSLLLMCEVAVAFMSSALLANDPFGVREAIGCCLVLGGSLVAPIAGLWPRRVDAEATPEPSRLSRRTQPESP
jgi:drug/metabolite transporter (DMT)-like permease